MADFAVVENNVVTNVVVADSTEVAEATTGRSVVPVVNGIPGVGWTRHNNSWREPSPFSSWVWDGSTWVPPFAPPNSEDHFEWDEEVDNWILVFTAAEIAASVAAAAAEMQALLNAIAEAEKQGGEG